MTQSALLRLRSVEGLAEMQNVVVKRLSAGDISAADALAALRSLKRLSAGDPQDDARLSLTGGGPWAPQHVA